MGLIDFHNLLRQCKLIITDSGGIQEEAIIIGKNILVNRNVTERIEAIDSNTGLKLLDPLAKFKTEQILNELKKNT